MRGLLIGLAVVAMVVTDAHAMDQTVSHAPIQLAQAQPDVINRNLPAPGQGVRPPRYICIIKPPPSDAEAGRYSCPASPGRVGGSCRCPNTVGSGKLRQY